MDGFRVWLLVGCAMACADPRPEIADAAGDETQVACADRPLFTEDRSSEDE